MDVWTVSVASSSIRTNGFEVWVFFKHWMIFPGIAPTLVEVGHDVMTSWHDGMMAISRFKRGNNGPGPMAFDKKTLQLPPLKWTFLIFIITKPGLWTILHQKRMSPQGKNKIQTLHLIYLLECLPIHLFSAEKTGDVWRLFGCRRRVT